MAPKKTMKNLSRKGVSAKKAGAVKGGMKKPIRERLAANHNLIRVLFGLATRNHNLVAL